MNDFASADDARRLLAERYREALASDRPWNAVLETLLSHRSVRHYLPDPVPQASLDLIIAAAQSASTSSNLQTWSVVAVEDADRKARLSMLVGNQGHVREAPLFLVWLADLARLAAIATARQTAVEGLQYLELLIIGIVDATLAAQNAATALESLGLGCVFIGGIRNQPENVAKELGLPPMVFPVFGMCVGTPDPARPAAIKPRLPAHAVLHREQYCAARQEGAVATYDQVMHAFQSEQNLPQEDWSERCVNRVRTPQSLTGRHRMREALTNLGFHFK
jgi:nitroreductase